MSAALIGIAVTIAIALLGVVFSLGKLYQKVDDIASKVDSIVQLETELDGLGNRTTALEVRVGMRRAADAS